MTYPVSGFDDGTHISTTVKWYDPAKGYGFLVPDDGSPDIYCRAPALAAVGLETLLAGAAVACETAQGLRGPEVSRIVAVDFSATTPRQASFANARGNGRMPAGPGRAESGPGASGRTIRAMVKWFHPVKGYGFPTTSARTAPMRRSCASSRQRSRPSRRWGATVRGGPPAAFASDRGGALHFGSTHRNIRCEGADGAVGAPRSSSLRARRLPGCGTVRRGRLRS